MSLIESMLHASHRRRAWLGAASTFALSGCLACFASAAEAQTAAAAPASTKSPPAASDAAVSEVVITGSRAIVNGAQAPTPVTVVSREQLTIAAPTGIADALNQLPVFRDSLKPSTAGSSGTGQNGNGGNFLNLRALGPSRTLTLLDGRRAVASNLFQGATDVNLFPQLLISGVDVVTGGASAAYGSDAVAGVVNFVLDTNFTGVKGEVQAGLSTYDDGGSYKVGLAGGRDFADGRGHVVVSAERSRINGITEPDGRGFAAAGFGLIGNANSPPSEIILPNVRNSNISEGGLITSGPLKNMTFNPNGTLSPFVQGTDVTATAMSGGQGVAGRTNLTTALTTTNLFLQSHYDLNSHFTAYVEGEWAEVGTLFPTASAGVSNATIFNDNAFLSPAVKAQMQAAGITSFAFNRGGGDLGFVTVNTINDTYRTVVGVKGNFGQTWKSDLYWEHSHGDVVLRTNNDPIDVNVYNAVDAVVNPANGQTVCRTTLTNPTNGCVPINLFGVGAPSAAAAAYIRGTSYANLTTVQDSVSFDVHGQPFSTWAGPASVAAGAEYRKEQAHQITDAISSSIVNGAGIKGFPASLQNNPGGFALTNPQPISGEYSIGEGFAEIEAPLARDLPFIKALDLNAAIRYADYSNAGGATSWKVGLTDQITDDIRLRASRSRDIRAPDISELFTTGQQTVGQAVLDPQHSNTQVIVTKRAVGNPALLPEKADNTTFGVVLTPTVMPGLTASIDYYDITIHGVISTLSLQQIVNGCQTGDQSLCAFVVRNPDTTINSIITANLNLNVLKTSGVDIEVDYRTDMDRFAGNLGGALTFRALATHVSELSTTSSGITVDRAGQVGLQGGAPHWSATFSAEYSNGPVAVYLQDRLIQGGVYDVTLSPAVLSPAQNSVPTINYVDLTLQYKLPHTDDRDMLFLTVNNLFNQAPPIAPNGATLTPRPTNTQIYDVIGRYFTGGVRFRF
jgi:iron complex outermembrane receptor protein